MDLVLCISLDDSEINSCLIGNGRTGNGAEISCKRSIPTSSLCMLDNGKKSYVFGFDTSPFLDLIDNSCLISNCSDFMRHLVLSNINGESSKDSKFPLFVLLSDSIAEDSNVDLKDSFPIHYLLSDLKRLYSSWADSPIESVFISCSLSLFIGHSLLLEGAAKDCGFKVVNVVDESSMLLLSVLRQERILNGKVSLLSLCVESESTIISLSSGSLYSTTRYCLKECPSFCGTKFVLSLMKSLNGRSDLSQETLSQFISSSISALRYKSRVFLDTNSSTSPLHSSTVITDTLLQDCVASLSYELQTSIDACIDSRGMSRSDVQFVVIHGSFSNLAVRTVVKSLFPDASVRVMYRNDATLYEAFEAMWLSHHRSKTVVGDEIYEGEMDNGVRCGRGELRRDGNVIYRGFFRSGVYDGFGEEFNDGAIVYRGQFRNGMRHGVGELCLSAEVTLKCRFVDGQIEDGHHSSLFRNGIICFDGEFRDGMRNGEGKEYDYSGRLIFNGCFVNDIRCGVGCEYNVDGSYYEGNFENDSLNGDVKFFDVHKVLRSTLSYDKGERIGKGIEYDTNGYMLYEGGMDNRGYFSHGLLYYPGKGIRYDGEFLCGQYDGYGQLYDESGYLVYIGEFRKGVRDGEGKEYTKDTRVLFTGHFNRDKRNGKGKLFFSSGHFYEGDFTDGEMTGQGRLVWTDGQTYEGNVICGRKCGHGVLVWSDGSRYDGEWCDDKRQGDGKQYDMKGNVVYDGQWNDDKPNGHGKLFYNAGSYYDGDVVYEKRCGHGLLCVNNAVEYDGEWDDDKPHGYGVYSYGDGMVYEGQWAHGEKNGMGRLLYKNGNYFLGMFKDGKRHGKGCLLNPQGRIISEDSYSDS